MPSIKVQLQIEQELECLPDFPGWREKHSGNVLLKKQQLLEMAANNEKKPERGSAVGNALRNYINPTNSSYDSQFAIEIIKLRPDWFFSPSEVASKKKEQLLQIARKGDSRPSHNTVLGKVLSNYITECHKCYDEPFFLELKKIRPDWFSRGNADLKKVELLELAKKGSGRPNEKKYPLGRALGTYTRSSSGSYDPIFDSAIRSLRPDWFVDQTTKASCKKDHILQLARNEKKRPVSSVGRALYRYTSSSQSSYDQAFDIKLRSMRPDWFN